MHRLSFRRTLIVTFILIATLPIVALAIWLYYGLNQHIDEIARERHQVLAQNLATSVGTHLSGARQSLYAASVFIDHDDDEALVAEAIARQGYFRAVMLVTKQGISKRWPADALFYSAAGDEKLASLARDFLGGMPRAHSGVMPSPYDGRPTVFFAEHTESGVAFALLNLDPIATLGRRVHVGPKGYAAITDQNGQIVLHPDGEWMRGMASLIQWPVVQSAVRGESGIQSFSLADGGPLVAGFASVPEFNWAVVTPQSASELRSEHNQLVRTALWVGGGSLAAALALAIALSCWIARPLAKLAKAVQELPNNGYRAEFEELEKIAPRELDTLQRRSKEMAREVRHAIALRDRLNEELKDKVQAATQDLQDANSKLARQALIDDLTKLNNRRALWERVSDMENAQPDSYLPVQVMLFDLDNFKEINDAHGHAVGDLVLTHVAAMMEQETRDDDFVVRYGGDEFLIVLPHCQPETAQRRAEAIRQAVLSQPIVADDTTLQISMSVGIAESESRLSRPSFAELLKAADKAMYEAKQQKDRFRRGSA